MADRDGRTSRGEATRRKLAQAAQALFARQGFDRTTVDEIAAAAGVSRRTFFHHFESKEDVVLARGEAFERALCDAIRAMPREAPLLEVAERAVLAGLAAFDPDEARLLAALKRDTPALRMRDQGKYERLERAIAEALADRAGTTPDDLRTRLDAMLVTGVLRVGGEGWLEAATSGRPIEAYVREVVQALGAGVGGAGG